MDVQELRDILAKIEQWENREMFPVTTHLRALRQSVEMSRDHKKIVSRDLLIEVLAYVDLLVQYKDGTRALLGIESSGGTHASQSAGEG